MSKCQNIDAKLITKTISETPFERQYFTYFDVVAVSPLSRNTRRI
jgi:hypothetical protein